MTMSALKLPLQACVGERSNDLHSKARVSLLREELATLTKNHEHAIVLSQLLYWTQRTKDFHLMLEEEKENSEVRNNSPRYGWIYKTANDLIADTKLHVDRTSIRRYLRCLITKEWIQTRANPQSKWNRTIQYRVNVKKIQHDLIALGHHLSELSLWGLEDVLLREVQNSNEQDVLSSGHTVSSEEQRPSETAENCNGHFAPSSGHNALSSDHMAPSDDQRPSEMAENCNGQNAPSSGHNTLPSDYIAPSEEQLPSEMAENCNGHFAPSSGHRPHSSDHITPSEGQCPSEMAENCNGHFAHSNGHNVLSSDHMASSEEQHPLEMAENSNGHFAPSSGHDALSSGHMAPSEEQRPSETAENSNGHFDRSSGHNALSSDHMAPSEGQLPSEMAENCNGHFAPSSGHNAFSSDYIVPSEEQYPSEMAENSNGQNALSNGQNAHSKGQNARSNTESTTENKTEITKKEHRAGRTSAGHAGTSAGHAGTGAYACEEELDGSDREQEVPSSSAKVAALMVDLWRRHVNPEAISLTDERKRRLESLLSLHFQADLRLWESFCLRVKAAPFLMGEGTRKWQITLDWILAKGNLLKVLEGRFDDLERIEHQKNEQFKGVSDRETRSLLDSIQDPLWKNWCSQLLGIDPVTGGPLMDGDQLLKAVLTVSELKEITQARFMEFDERLVWIECFDQKTLNKIEDLRFKFSPIAQATFPKARAVRGYLNLSFNQPQFTQQKGHNAPSEEQCPLETAENCNGHFAPSSGHNTLSSDYIASSEEQHPPEMAENSNGHFALSNGQNAHSKGQNARSNTESTTENKTEITKKEHRAGHGRTGAYAYACEEELDGSDREQEVPSSSAKVAALMVDLWRRHVNPEAISLTDERKRRLKSLLSLHFQSDLRLWESFCLRVKAAPFLMGEGKRKWQITLDWTLAKGNLLKVLEGNFDDLERIEHQKNEQFKGVSDRETRSLLDSIQDPLWKNWCSQLLGIDPITGGPLMGGGQPLKAVLTVSELKEITQARFMEFDERLVWIECFDQKTLNKIEDLRFKLSPVAQATFPKARAVRGYLNLSFNQPSSTQQKGENHAE
jgi:hypothetical protein